MLDVGRSVIFDRFRWGCSDITAHVVKRVYLTSVILLLLPLILTMERGSGMRGFHRTCVKSLGAKIFSVSAAHKHTTCGALLYQNIIYTSVFTVKNLQNRSYEINFHHHGFRLCPLDARFHKTAICSPF